MKDIKLRWGIGLLIIAIMLGYTCPVQAASMLSGYEAWQTGIKATDDVLKPWKINFSQAVTDNVGTIKSYVFITDNNNNLFGTDISVSTDGKSATIYPQASTSYQTGAEYRLYIGDELSSQSGEKLSRAIVMPFSVSTSGHIVNMNDSFNSLCVTFTLNTSASVFTAKVNGVSMDYEGSHIYEKSLTGLDIGDTVNFQVYDGLGGLLETQAYVIR